MQHLTLFFFLSTFDINLLISRNDIKGTAVRASSGVCDYITSIWESNSSLKQQFMDHGDKVNITICNNYVFIV